LRQDKELINNCEEAAIRGNNMTFDELLGLISSRPQTRRICADSRLVKKGDVFVAVSGTNVDGHDFINDAAEKGAEFIVCERLSVCKNAEVIVVADSSRALALLAQAVYGCPASKLINLAVTGTNGKTTAAFLVRSIIQQAGQKCGLIGTIFYDTVSDSADASLTTPDAIAIAKMGEQMVNSGAKYMVIEASSHALAQNRLAGIDFKAAAFTNLSGDHLDYHKTPADYLAAKTKLFENLDKDAIAVLNKESPVSYKIVAKTKARILWYGIDTPADITAHIESMRRNESVFVLEHGGQREKVKSTLPGRYNVSNHLAAAGLCIAAGFDLSAVVAGLQALQSVPGRLEPVDCGQDFSVLIDYAHTDDALKNVLRTLKPLCKGRLTAVFGCGGDRDKTKRPRMAKAAERLADSVVVTSDNPRTEQPEKIIEDITAGFENAKEPKIKVEPDRKKAIELAITSAAKDDIVLIAGKGHERYQIIGTQRIEFSDKAVAEECLRVLDTD